MLSAKDYPLLKFIKIGGYAYFLIYAVLCTVFFKERVAYIDSATQLFTMINQEGFEIFVHRYSTGLSQILPLFLILLKAPLAWVMVAYSISFALIPLLCYHITVKYFKEVLIAILPAFFYISASDTFAHALSESVQMFSYAALLAAYLVYAKKHKKFERFNLGSYFILTFLLLLNFFIHPVSLFLVLMIFLVVFYQDFNAIKTYKWLIPSLWIGLFVIKTLLFTEGSHDQTFLSELNHIDEILPNLFSSYPIVFLKVYFFRFFWIPTVLLLSNIAYFIYKKKYIFISLYVLFYGAFFLLSLIIYHKGDSNHGMERSFLPFLFFSLFPFLLEILPSLIKKNRIIVSCICLVLIGTASINIVLGIVKFNKRTNKLIQTLSIAENNNLGEKIYLSDKDKWFDTDMEVKYATAVESILLTSLESRNNTRSIFYDQGILNNIKNAHKANDYYFMPWWVFRSTTKFNPAYFNLNDAFYAELAFQKRLVSKIRFTPGAKEILKSNTGTINLNFDFNANQIKDFQNKPCYIDSSEYILSLRPKFNGQHKVKAIANIYATSYNLNLVISCGNDIYTSVRLDSSKIYTWEKLSVEVNLPPSINPNELVIYLWNPTLSNIYVKDFLIEEYTLPVNIQPFEKI